MRLIERVHGGVHERRVRTLCAHLAPLFPPHARVLDVGSGDGLLARRIALARPDLAIEGIDVLVRENARIPVLPFDGSTIPHGDAAFDAVLFVDVLHHTHDPLVLLREARRVARRAILIKDHTRNGLLAGPTLRFMDRVGNARHGVALPFNYWTRRQWRNAFRTLDLEVAVRKTRLGLYPAPANWIFGRSLHFIARLHPRA